MQRTKTCDNCNASFGCGPGTSGGTCWCSRFPPIVKLEEGNDCLCPTCLKDKLKAMIQAYVSDMTPEKARSIDHTRYRTPDMEEGIDYYVENGLYVFTGWHHLKRGHCCESGCRHCPYGFNLPE